MEIPLRLRHCFWPKGSRCISEREVDGVGDRRLVIGRSPQAPTAQMRGALTGPLSFRFGNAPDKAPPKRTYTAVHSTPGTASPFHSAAPFHPPRLRSAYRFGSGRSVL